VNLERELLGEDAEDLFEDAPCGYLSTAPDGTIRKVNRTFESWTGLRRQDLLGKRRFQDLLTAPGRIYHETHYSPLLRMQGAVNEIALELVRADGSRLPVLVNSVLIGKEGEAQLIRTTVFDASERRRYEEELLRARRGEQEIAQRLQRSMLAGDLPSAPNLEIVATYRPAVSGLEIGGDWYDAFWLDAQRVGLVVGDVVGRGIEAAATMGQLRSATRALASTGLRPADLLEALDGFAARHRVGAMTTVLYAELALDSLELRFSCAGHLPPLVASEGESPRLVWEGRSAPLTVGRDGGGRRPEARCPLGRGGLVLLFTDGLVERRGHLIDERLDRLLELVHARRAEPLRAMTEGVVRTLEDDAAQDDVCMLSAALADLESL
jgi:sigma-B regulation protein RsbU (phosphoserine phosphatase)